MNRRQRRAAAKARRRRPRASVEAKLQAALSHHQAGQLAEAKRIYEEILSTEPKHAVALHLLGAAKLQEGDAGAAVDLIGKAIAIKPRFAEAHNNLGNALKDMDRLEDATAAFRKAIEVQPDFAKAQGNLIFAMNFDSRFPQADIFAESRRWEEVHGAPQGGGGRRHANDRDAAERRLRVGYVSPDFREHSVSYFLGPLLEEHDRSRFEVFCYAEVANPGCHCRGAIKSSRCAPDTIYRSLRSRPSGDGRYSSQAS